MRIRLYKHLAAVDRSVDPSLLVLLWKYWWHAHFYEEKACILLKMHDILTSKNCLNIKLRTTLFKYIEIFQLFNCIFCLFLRFWKTSHFKLREGFSWTSIISCPKLKTSTRSDLFSRNSVSKRFLNNIFLGRLKTKNHIWEHLKELIFLLFQWKTSLTGLFKKGFLYHLKFEKIIFFVVHLHYVFSTFVFFPSLLVCCSCGELWRLNLLKKPFY